MPRKPPAIEPPDAANLPDSPDSTSGPKEETTPLEGSEPTGSAGASTSSATGTSSETGTSSASGTSSTTGSSSASGSSGNRFFSWIRGIDIRREPGWIGGVCAGIAARLGIDPLIVRGIAVVIAVLGGPAILLYAVAWLLLPDANDKIHLEEVFRGRLESPIAAIGALIVLSILPVTQGIWYAGAGFWGEPHWGSSAGRAIWTIALLGALVWFIVWLARRGSAPVAAPATRPRDASAFVAGDAGTTAPTMTFAPTNATEPELAAWREHQAQVRAEQDAFRNQQASDKAAANRAAAEEARRKRAEQREVDRAENTRTRSHPLFSLIVIGLSIVAGGLATVAVAGEEITVGAAVVGLSVMLAVLAIGIIINGVRGKRSGGAAGVAAIVLPVLLVTAAASTSETSVVRWGPTTELSPTTSQSFSIGAGRVELDLTGVEFRDSDFRSETFHLSIGAGDVTVVIPSDVTVQFNGTVAAGSIDTGDEGTSTRVGPIQTSFAQFFPDPAPTNPDTDPLITVDVQMGAGKITVVEEGVNR